MGHNLTLLELAQVRSGKPTTKRCREILGESVRVLAKANAIIQDNPGISPAGFEGVYLGRQVRSVGVASLFTECEYRFREMGRIASEDSYRAARMKLIEFGGEGLTLNVIDVDFLRRFAQWMKSEGYSVSSTGVYLRNLRAVFNMAIDRRILSSDLHSSSGETFTQ